MKRASTILLFLLLFTGYARAGVLLEADAMMDVHSIYSGSDSSFTQSMYSGGIYFSVNSKKTFYAGVHYLMGASTESSTTGDKTFSNQDIMLAMKWFMDKAGVFSLTAAYGVTSKAQYKDPSISQTEDWNGTSMLAKLTAAPALGADWNLGFSLVYYLGTFSEKRVQTTASDVSNTRSYMGPSLTLYYRF